MSSTVTPAYAPPGHSARRNTESSAVPLSRGDGAGSSRRLNQFSAALAANYYKFTGLKQKKIFIYNSGGQKSQMDMHSCVLSGISRKASVSLPFPSPRSLLNPLAVGPFFHLRSHQCSIFQSLFLYLRSSSFPFLGSMQLHWAHLENSE